MIIHNSKLDICALRINLLIIGNSAITLFIKVSVKNYTKRRSTRKKYSIILFNFVGYFVLRTYNINLNNSDVNSQGITSYELKRLHQ